MKMKILRRILAAIIASSSIMMVPGGASAVKKISDSARKRLKQNADSKTKNMGQMFGYCFSL